MHIAWTAHLANNPVEKKRFEEQLASAKPVLERLQELIDGKLNGISNTEHSVTSYEKASWLPKQAHLNGRRAELTDITNLLKG